MDETKEVATIEKASVKNNPGEVNSIGAPVTDSLGDAIDKAIESVEQQEWKVASKRFELKGESSKMLSAYREEVKNFQATAPEVVGATVYGSHTKGKANSTSDIDSYVFVDTDMLGNQDYEAFTSGIGAKFKEKVGMRFSLDATKLKDIKYIPLSQELLDSQIDGLIDFYTALDDYSKNGGNYPEQPTSDRLGEMFHLQIGRGLDSYRAYVLERFSQAGKSGEHALNLILNSAIGWEQDRDRGEIRIPKSIGEAKKYFKLENVKPKYGAVSELGSVEDHGGEK